MDQLVFSTYRFVLLPFAYGLVRVLAYLRIKNKFFDALMFRMKNEFHYKPTFDHKKGSIGVHAASGEIEYALPLIRKLKEKHPNFNILVTLSSTSVLKAVQNQPLIDAVGPAPIDLFWVVGRFIKKFKFKLFLFSRTDVWPEISTQLKKEKIPTYLFSATFSESSSKKGLFANSLTRWALNQLTQIFSVTSDDKKNIENIGVRTTIQITGDTRYDQVFFKKDQVKKTLPVPNTSKHILVAGSTWLEDDMVLFPAFVFCADKWNFVIAPHEVTEETVKRIEGFFQKHNLKTERFSKLAAGTGINDWNALVIDQYGYLFHLYQWADLTFVGGSFKSKIHSVMEPLCFAKPVCVGPYHSNNREALDFRQITVPYAATTYVQPFDKSEDLVNLLKLHSEISSEKKAKIAAHLQSLLVERCGSTEATFREIRF